MPSPCRKRLGLTAPPPPPRQQPAAAGCQGSDDDTFFLREHEGKKTAARDPRTNTKRPVLALSPFFLYWSSRRSRPSGAFRRVTAVGASVHSGAAASQAPTKSATTPGAPGALSAIFAASRVIPDLPLAERRATPRRRS
ncbi:hypothetical protein HPB50_009158 [Hyalomma asiaticum]|uniref:Uncharacterized protein n=1 Tax=Hyalomma asiaticum TaxID=266040 RepID=A0ACB7S2H3_HYAAI|nr:hypothetical protein HPB50_009158 [Hyalomma asiaticum]